MFFIYRQFKKDFKIKIMRKFFTFIISFLCFSNIGITQNFDTSKNFSQDYLYYEPQPDFAINNYDVLIHVSQKGKLNVQETISLNFNYKRHGLIRFIPFAYPPQKEELGKKFLDIENIEVYRIIDGKKEKENFKTSIYQDVFSIKIGNADVLVDGKQTYIINYDATGPILKRENEDFFAWNLIGTDWDTTIDKVKATIIFPDDISNLKDQISLYKGKFKEQNEIFDYLIDRNIFSYNLNEPLNKKEGMSIFISFPSKYFEPYPISYYIKYAIFFC